MKCSIDEGFRGSISRSDGWLYLSGHSPMEKFKPVVGFPYLIGDKGTVINFKGRKMKWLYSRNTKYYPWVDLRSKRKRRCAMVHLLVAEAFIGPKPASWMEVHHKDFNKNNPAAENLQYLDPDTHKDIHEGEFSGMPEMFFTLGMIKEVA